MKEQRNEKMEIRGKREKIVKEEKHIKRLRIKTTTKGQFKQTMRK